MNNNKYPRRQGLLQTDHPCEVNSNVPLFLKNKRFNAAKIWNNSNHSVYINTHGTLRKYIWNHKLKLT